MNSKSIIQLENVTKKFKKKPILENINLTIYQGQSIALTGHNGVGKSTLLKIIAKLIKVDSGNINYLDPLLFHYVPEQFPRNNLTVKEYLTLICRLDDHSKQVTEEKIKAFLGDFFMTHMADTPLNYLSKGSLQKVGVIQALITTPDVLLLDEPLSGQDAKSQRVFIQKMKDLLADGMTIIMSCHEPYLINEISDTVIEINDRQISVKTYEKQVVKEVFVLTFVNEKGDFVVPELDIPTELNVPTEFNIPLELNVPWDQENQHLKLYVPPLRTDEIIQQMMSYGWSLREMYQENE